MYILELGSLIATFVIQNEPEINHIVLKNVVSYFIRIDNYRLQCPQ